MTIAVEFGPYLGLLTWDEAAIEIARFNERTGAAPGEKPYRLPTEDEVRGNPEEFNPSSLWALHNFLDNPHDFWCGPFKNVAGRIAGPESTFGGGSDGRIGIKHHVRLVRR